jgi:hypothetical protein
VIKVEFFRAIKDEETCEPELVARVVADGRDIRFEGPEPDFLDPEQSVLNLRDGCTITCADNPEEWARGLAVSFRTPYLSARVVEDTVPLGDVDIARADVREPVFR